MAQQVLATASARRPAALLLLDLDGFKEVNDSLGHAAGDTLLRQVGPRLRGALRASDTLARLGGDEFAVLLPDAGLDAAQEQAERIRDLLAQPFSPGGIRLHVGVSIGVATAPVPAATVEELLRCADVAMYAAEAGREGVRTSPTRTPAPVTGCTPWRSCGRRWTRAASSPSTCSRRSTSPTAASSAPGPWSADTTRPAACSPPPTCCPPPSRPGCCGRWAAPSRSWRWTPRPGGGASTASRCR
ncbi:GGDEF domain-containing protein [Geodermatophilus sp. SYSU D01176]